jgi:hypothetical protein
MFSQINFCIELRYNKNLQQSLNLLVNAEITFLLFKERRPFKLKKECPSEQWQVISFRLIPLKTPVSFRWTVPLMFP